MDRRDLFKAAGLALFTGHVLPADAIVLPAVKVLAVHNCAASIDACGRRMVMSLSQKVLCRDRTAAGSRAIKKWYYSALARQRDGCLIRKCSISVTSTRYGLVGVFRKVVEVVYRRPDGRFKPCPKL